MENDKKKTLVFGASLNPMRVSNMAILRLMNKGYEVVAVGGREGTVDGVEIQKGNVLFDDVHTITMYMGAARQEEHLEYLLSLRPKRIIFNPGAENPDLYHKAKEKGIEVLNACTLVMLATGQY